MMSVSFVAEVSSNHHRNLDRCLEFVDEAARIGCTAVKFQLFKVEKLFAPEILSKSKMHRDRKNWELPLEYLPEIAERCERKKINFGCTPFYLEAVSELEEYVDFFKIASYELLWDDLLERCGQTDKPVVISTGMATLKEVEHAVDVLRRSSCRDITALHCVSSYPASVDECNLAAIETMREKLGIPIGWSDHTVDPGILYRAVLGWGAEMVEFHLDLEGKGDEYSSGHCWLPDSIGEVIRSIQHGFAGNGSGEKEPTKSEQVERDWRADPKDGLRPFTKVRGVWGKK